MVEAELARCEDELQQKRALLEEQQAGRGPAPTAGMSDVVELARSV